MSDQKISTPEKYQTKNNGSIFDSEFDTYNTPHLSVTQLKMFLRCPLQYEFRYIKHLKVPPSGALTLGKAIHSVLEKNYRQKIKTKQNLPVEHWKDLFSDTWEKNAKETIFKEDEKPGTMKDDGIKLLQTYHNNIAPKIQPVGVEKEFLIELEHLKHPILGYIDLIDDKGYIIDHKVSKRSWPKGKEHTDLQLTAYSLAYKQLEGKKEKGLRFDVMVRNKEPKIQQLSTKRNQQDINRFKKLIVYVSCSIENSIFYPNENYMCPSCGYADLCKKW
jgi:putative RecB family exonuclease